MRRKPFGIRLLASAFLWLALVTAQAATITVTSTADTGAGVCTLRDAITAANTNIATGGCVKGDALPTVDTIAFNIPGSGVHTISPATALPNITEAVILDGYTQPGTSANTLSVGNNAVLLIEIEGSNLGGACCLGALKIQGPNGGSTIRGLVINRFGSDRIQIGASSLSSNNTIAGNFIGTDPTGTTIPAGPSPTSAISIGGSSNRIGGTTPAARNLIVVGGNVAGSANIDLGSGGSNLIQGNYLSTNAAGTAALGLATDGIKVGSGGNIIGGTAPGAGNVIVTGRFGIILNGASVSNNVIQGNLIGTDATGTAGLGFFIGIATGNGATNNTIGGAAAGAGNVISGGSTGILIGDAGGGWIIQGNRIGTDITGTLPIPNTSLGIQIQVGDPSGVNKIGGTNPGEGNTIAFNGGAGVLINNPAGSAGWGILRNSIFSNAGLGITFGGSGVPTLNDNCDLDMGSNGLQNYPVITSASIGGGNATISGTLNSTASTTFRVEFFSSAVCDPSGNGEGQTFLGATSVTTGSTCNASFGPLVFAAPGGQSVITSTATDPSNNTSEFSACLVAPADLTLTKTHAGNFAQGQIGATYTIVVTNSGAGATAGTVTMSDTVPAGLTPTSASGTGWTCGIAGQVVTCTRSDVLAAAASYPSITLTVNVAGNAPSVTNTATVSGGGETNIANDSASDVTTIVGVSTPAPAAAIPTQGESTLLLLSALLALLGAYALKRRVLGKIST